MSIPNIQYLQQILGQMAHNVPAVCDGLPARISKCAAFAGRAKCGGEKPHKGRKPDCGFS